MCFEVVKFVRSICYIGGVETPPICELRNAKDEPVYCKSIAA